MIRFTEKILYFIKRDNINMNSKKDLKEYIIKSNLLDELKTLAGDKFDLALTRVYEIVSFMIIHNN